MKHYQLFSILVISISTVGCAITSGLQTYDIPTQGNYTTDLGTNVNVIQITQENLPAIQPAQIDYRNNYSMLFKQQPVYRLSSGDVLSIQLWAYPEISGNTSTDPKVNGYTIDQDGYIQLP